MKIFYSPRCLDYSQPGHPESPARVRSAYEYLEEKGYEFTEPKPCTDEDILLAHTQSLLDSIRKENFFDLDTPSFPDIYGIAKLSAGGAVDAAMHCMTKGEKAFSLMRPPGHHATNNNLGGFCYFNNIAIASLRAKEKAGKVAIVDFDCHHGNGTEDIFLGKSDFLYLSLHQSPLYPGTGLKSRENCINYPLPSSTTPDKYLATLEQGLKKVQEFNPGLLALSAGFDSYKLDPITSLSLETETYRQIGKMLASLKKPTFAILEGGYSRDLPECVYEFLQGLEG
ncbi:MAG: histone deacetylase [Nitrospiraceae bacterium]|nr:MAG: histone deacetylase [Nitrospiraceae bacterium]